MALSGMRGLSVFISDIRNCQNKEQERLRVDKELGNIRTRFKNEKASFRVIGCVCVSYGGVYNCCMSSKSLGSFANFFLYVGKLWALGVRTS